MPRNYGKSSLRTSPGEINDTSGRDHRAGVYPAGAAEQSRLKAAVSLTKMLLKNPAALRKLNLCEVIAIQRTSHLAEIL